MKLPFDSDAVLAFGSFTVSVADAAAQRQQAAAWLEAEHFPGSFRPVGHSLAQVILEDGWPVALLQWAACAYHLKDREAWTLETPRIEVDHQNFRWKSAWRLSLNFTARSSVRQAASPKNGDGDYRGKRGKRG